MPREDANRLLFTGFSQVRAGAPRICGNAPAQNVAGRNPVAMISSTPTPTA
jgi:hypothetical protein